LLVSCLVVLPLISMAQILSKLHVQMKYYLFTYFTNNTTAGQQICYAVSDNGLDFTPLNDGRPVISSDTISVSGGVRDPHLLRAHDGWFYQVATDMDMSKGKWTCRGFVMMRQNPGY